MRKPLAQEVAARPIRVLVCGSRKWRSTTRILARLASLPEGSVIMHGAAQGADRCADRAARGLDLEVEEYPADWKRDGKRAGILRNLDMLEAHPDLVLAFWDGKSRGTAHVIREAQRRGIPVEIHLATRRSLDA